MTALVTVMMEPYYMPYDTTTVSVTYDPMYQIINIDSMTVRKLNADEETTTVMLSHAAIMQANFSNILKFMEQYDRLFNVYFRYYLLLM